MKVSIVIPVYNVEDYLKCCIESCINQTLKDIEIILVNDGSTDNSLKICQEYTQKDSRIKLITKQNEGVSVARNVGIENAKGEYIQFLDADDWLELDCLELAYNQATKENADILFLGYNLVKGEENKRNNIDILRRLQLNPFNLLDLESLTFTIWDKIYKREFINTYNIRFVKDLTTAEDGIFNLFCLFKMPKTSFATNCLYNYRYLRDGSATSKLKLESEIQSFKYFINTKEFKNAKYNFKIMSLDKHLVNILRWYFDPVCQIATEHNKILCIKLHKYLLKNVGFWRLIRCVDYKFFSENFPIKQQSYNFLNKIIVNISTSEHNIFQIRLFNKPVIEILINYFNPKRISWKFLTFLRPKPFFKSKNPQTFYLKINRKDAYAIRCIQHWIDIITELKADFYIICDKPELELEVLKKVRFNNRNIKFIKSIKNKKLKPIVENIATPLWYNATYAHLTSFYHAKKHNIKYFWNIDADDTMFSLYADKVADILKNIKQYARENTIAAFSLDMHTSKTYGKHWSFGICYIDNTIDWIRLFENNKSKNWRNNYIQYDSQFNLDWFFTYLRDEQVENIKSFYIDNMQFIHFGDFMWNTMDSGVYHFENNKIIYPILLEVFGTRTFGEIPIWSKCVKFNNNMNKSDCFNFMYKFQTYLDVPSLPRDNMWLPPNSLESSCKIEK